MHRVVALLLPLLFAACLPSGREVPSATTTTTVDGGVDAPAPPPLVKRPQRALALPTASRVSASLLATTVRDEIVVGGSFLGELRLGAQSLGTSAAKEGSGFVIALGRDGELRWSWVFDGAPLDLATDAAGHVHVVGAARATALAEGDDVTRGGAMVVRIEDGRVAAVDRYLGVGTASAYKLALDAEGTRYVAMSAAESFELAGRRYVVTDPYAAPNVLAELDASNELLGAFETKGRLAALAADRHGPTYVAHGEATPLRFAPDGPEIYANEWLTRRRSQRLLPLDVHAMTIDADGTVVVAGDFAGQIVVGGTELKNAERYMSGYDAPCYLDAFVGGFGLNGNPQWATALGDRGDDTFMAVSRAPDGRLWLGGTESYACNSFSGPMPGRPLLVTLASDRTVAEKIALGIDVGSVHAIAHLSDGGVVVLGLDATAPVLLRLD